MENRKNDYIFGIRPVIEAIESGQTIDKLLVKRGLTGDLVKELLAVVAAHRVPMQQVPLEKIERITRKNHQGVVAFLSSVDFRDLDEVLDRAYSQGRDPFIMVLDQITDVRNLGAIVRTAECAGADAVLVPSRGSARIGADAVKTSAGALYHMPLCRADNLAAAVRDLRRSGLRVVCATEKADSDYRRVDFRGPLALVMGAEDTGIAPDILRVADDYASIPVLGRVGSLNVASAAAVLMYEAVGQRRG